MLPESDKTFYENIETIVEQADEVDSLYLQFEGGASTTAFVLDGIFKLSEKFNKLPEAMNVDRIAKFVNYISSKRYPTQVKAAFNILSIAVKLTDNQVSLFRFFFMLGNHKCRMYLLLLLNKKSGNREWSSSLEITV